MTPVNPQLPAPTLEPPGERSHRSPEKPPAEPAVPLDLNGAYRLYAPLVSRWAQRLAGPGADLEDMVHDVFLVVQRRLGEFRGEAQLSTWLFEITVRVVQTHRRRRSRWWWPFPNDEGGVAGALVDHNSSPLEDLERREATVLLYRFLDELDEKYRTPVILFELEGLSCQEISRITHTSLANVWARVSRGREQLMRAFAASTARKKLP